jgi:Ca-activated chloride channel homolog
VQKPSQATLILARAITWLSVFAKKLTATIFTIAQNAKIQVEFNPVVERYRLLGYENRDVTDEVSRNDAVDAGEIGAGHSVTALYEVKIADDGNPAETVLTVRPGYADPETEEVTEIASSLAPQDFAASFIDASPLARFGQSQPPSARASKTDGHT